MRQAQRRKLAEQKNRKAIVKAKTSTPASQRVEKVKVKVEPRKALPAGKKGGDLASTKGSRRRNINKNADGAKPRMGRPAPKKALPQGRSGVSSKRAMAAAKLERARQGTKSTKTRTGQPAGAANRIYGAKKVNAAVKRAQANQLQGRKVGGPSKKGGLGAALIGKAADKLLGPVAKSAGYNIGKTIRKAVGGGSPTLDKNGKKINSKAKAKSTKTETAKPKPARTRTQNRRSSSSSTPAKPTPTKPKSNNAAAINAQLKKERAAREKAASRSSGGNNSQILRSAPGKGDPKPKPKPSPVKSKPAPAKPKPAAKSAAKPKSKPRSWLKDNYKPGVKGIKSSCLSKALSNLKVKDYKKKK